MMDQIGKQLVRRGDTLVWLALSRNAHSHETPTNSRETLSVRTADDRGSKPLIRTNSCFVQVDVL